MTIGNNHIHIYVNKFGVAKPLNVYSFRKTFCQKLSDRKRLSDRSFLTASDRSFLTASYRFLQKVSPPPAGPPLNVRKCWGTIRNHKVRGGGGQRRGGLSLLTAPSGLFPLQDTLCTRAVCRLPVTVRTML